MSKQDRFYTVAALAERLCVAELTVRRLIVAGKLPAVRLGRAVRISPAAVDSFLDSVRVGPAGLREPEAQPAKAPAKRAARKR